MPIQRRRAPIRMQTRPVVREHDELDADQAQRAIGHRFVDQRFRLIRVQYAVEDTARLDVMHAHRAGIGSADAWGASDPRFGLVERDVDIEVWSSSCAYLVDQWRNAAL